MNALVRSWYRAACARFNSASCQWVCLNPDDHWRRRGARPDAATRLPRRSPPSSAGSSDHSGHCRAASRFRSVCANTLDIAFVASPLVPTGVKQRLCHHVRPPKSCDQPIGGHNLSGLQNLRRISCDKDHVHFWTVGLISCQELDSSMGNVPPYPGRISD